MFIQEFEREREREREREGGCWSAIVELWESDPGDVLIDMEECLHVTVEQGSGLLGRGGA